MGRTSANNDVYQESIRQKLDETCNWILDRPTFQHWISPKFDGGTAKFLWINGPAGFGKTILCARLVEHISSTCRTPVGHFFFSSEFGSHEDPFVAVRSWISQFLPRAGVSDLVYQNWSANEELVATNQTVIELFRDIISATPLCTVVVDGLDECTGSVTGFLEAVMGAVQGTTTRVMIVSRDEVEIRETLTTGIRDGLSEYRILHDDVLSDTGLYAKSIVDRKLSNKPEDLRSSISQSMANRCKGQFQWLKMQEGQLRRGLNQKQLQRAIEEAPVELSHVYDRNWERIMRRGHRDRSRAISLLRWAAFALRPLTIREIAVAVLISEDSNELAVDELPDSIDEDFIDSEILGLCGSLLEIRSPTSASSTGLKTVHLAHFSVKQYLLRKLPVQGQLILANERVQSSSEPNVHTILAQLCLRYISGPQAWQATSDERGDDLEMSFCDYAAGSWNHHTNLGVPGYVTLATLMKALFDIGNPNWSRWREWFDSHDEESKEEESTAAAIPPTPLYYASKLGLTELAIYLLEERDYNVNEKTTRGWTPLAASCIIGNLELTKALLKAGADIESIDCEGRTALYMAAHDGHAKVAELLLDNGAGLEVQNNYGTTPVNIASDRGHVEVVSLLLRKGANPDTANHAGWAPLANASYEGHMETVKLLLDKKANPDTRGKEGWTPLYLALYGGYIEMANLLLSHGANPDIPTQDGWTPLQIALFGGHIEVVKSLLEKGVNPEPQNCDRWTALHIASHKGDTDTVEMLIGKGAKLEAQDKDGWTPLHIAVNKGHTAVTELLLRRGADPETPSNSLWTPLLSATSDGNIEIIMLLLENGADTSRSDAKGNTPLSIASHKGYVEVVKALLDHGSDATIADVTGETPLMLASREGHLEVVRLLLDSHPTELNRKDSQGRTPLFHAARRGRHDVVQELLANPQVLPNPRNWQGPTPLFAAAMNGHAKTVQALLAVEDGSSFSPDGSQRGLLWWSRYTGNEQITEILVRHAKAVGVKIHDDGDDEPRVRRDRVTFDPKGRFCDACTMTIPDAHSFYHCQTCSQDNFDICVPCIELGVKCLDSSHVLKLNEGKVEDSNPAQPLPI